MPGLDVPAKYLPLHCSSPSLCGELLLLMWVVGVPASGSSTSTPTTTICSTTQSLFSSTFLFLNHFYLMAVHLTLFQQKTQKPLTFWDFSS